MDEGKTIGFALTKDGDIEGVFKNKAENHTHHAMDGIMPQAIEMGGTKLDCYGEQLVSVYERYGFQPVARVEFNEEFANVGWDESKGRPYIYFMVHNGDSASTVVQNFKNYEHMSYAALEQLPTYDKNGYDHAAAYRDTILANRKNGGKVGKFSMKESTDGNVDSKGGAVQKESAKDPMRKREGADLLSIMRPSVKEDINQAVNTYGAIPEGENPVRDIKVPRRVIPNAKVRQTVRTALESSVTPESLVPTIEQSVIEGNFNYAEDTNKSQMERANKWIEGRTIEDARDDWFRSIGKKATPDVIARGMLLYNQYATASNDTNLSDSERRANRETATRILNDISVSTTESAQMVQMIRILKKQTPDMQLYALKRNIQKIQDQLDAKYGGKKNGAPQIVLNEGMAEQWLSALRRGDQDLAHDTEAALLQDIANQVPARFMDKWNAWRYLCMLGNPKTIIRNTGGNIAMMPMKSAKDKIGATLELAFVKKENRTKYLGSLLSTKKGRAMLDFAGTDFKEFDVQDMLTGVGKYHDSDIGTRLNAAIRDAQGTFSTPVLKQWQAATNYLMNEAPGISDMAFMQHHYKNSFAQAALARGYTAEDFASGRISEQQLDSLRGYAVNQALKATYRDANMVSNAVRKMRFKSDSVAAKIGNIALEGIIPFRSTPANVLVRAVEYGPVGLLKAISYESVQLARGKISGTQFIEHLSAGITGTAVFGLGYLLSSLGILRVNADDDDKREGRQAYSLEIGDTSITLDWLAPAAVPLFMGAEVNELTDREDGTSIVDAILDSASRLASPILEMSMMSSVQDLLNTLTYARNGADVAQIVYSFFALPFLNYVGQGIPTALSQIANAFEPNRTATYVGDINSQIGRNFVRNLARITEKIPFVDWRQIDYVDEWGNKQSNGSIVERIFNNFLNPAYVSKIHPTDADSEIRRLKETLGDAADGIEPKRRDTSITVGTGDDKKTVKLNGKQYEAYETEYGKQFALMAASFLASDYYDTLTDKEKVKVFDDIESLANEYGKVAAGVGYTLDSEESGNNKLYTLTNAGIPIAEAYSAKLMHSYLENDDSLKPTDRYEQFRVWMSTNNVWTEEQKQLVEETYGAFHSGYTVKSDNFDEMVATGLSAEKARSVSEEIGKLTPIGDADQPSDLQKLQVIARAKYLNAKEKDAAIRAYASGDAQKKYDRWSKAGASPDVYVGIMTEINNLKPVGGNKSVTDNQMVNVIANYRGISDKQRWDLMRAYYTSESDSDTNRKNREKFTAAQNAGFDAATYMYCRLALNDAKGHDLDGNGHTDSNSVRNAKAALIRGFNISDDLKNFLWSMDYPKQKPYSWQSDVKEGKG